MNNDFNKQNVKIDDLIAVCFRKMLPYLVGALFVILIIFFISSASLNFFGISFRQWVLNLNFIFFIIFLISGTILILKRVYKIIEKPVIKVLVTIIILLGLGVITLYSLVNFMFDSNSECLAYRNGKLVVASTNGFLNTDVKFYIPIGNMLMKKSNLQSFYYSGAFNIYMNNNNLVLKNGHLNLNNNINAISFLNPYAANQIFGSLEYIGDDTYKFKNNITMKFNSQETALETLDTTSDIFTYGNVNIIGNNIYNFEAELLEELKTNGETAYFINNKEAYNIVIINKKFDYTTRNLTVYTDENQKIVKLEMKFPLNY
ncbi:MAG: hypothetical protein ACRC41_16685 [Sarcina sp.]